MRLIKMKIARNYTLERTRYSYPKEYDAFKVKYGPFYETGAKERGQDYQYILFGVADTDAPAFLKAHGVVQGNFTFEAVEQTRDQALALGNAWTEQTEQITDQAKVLSITAKAARGKVLTQAERDALDPDNPAPGVNKTAPFSVGLDKALAKW